MLRSQGHAAVVDAVPLTRRLTRYLPFVLIGLVALVWKAPGFAAPKKNSLKKDLSRGSIIEPVAESVPHKAETLVLPKAHFDDVSLIECLSSLSEECKRLDAGASGIQFLLTPEAAASGAKLTLDLKNIPLVEAVKYVTSLTNTSYKLRDDGIIVIDVLRPRAETPQDRVDTMLMLYPEEEPFSFETLYGSAPAVEALQNPESIEVYRITSEVSTERRPKRKTILGHTIMKGPVTPAEPQRGDLIELFKSQQTFQSRPMCGGAPAVLVRACRGKTTIDLRFCFKCHDVVILRNDQRIATYQPEAQAGRFVVGMTAQSARKFLALFQALFPKDPELSRIDGKNWR
jgi:hypothetical protein